MSIEQSHEYINDFLYFVIKPDENGTDGDLICCSGVNVTRFTPITKGRHNPMSNPAIRGLQLIQYDIMALAKNNGTMAKAIRGHKAKGLPPTEEIWSTACLAIRNAPATLPGLILNHCVVEILKKIYLACTRQDSLPETMLSPDELQLFIESLCNKHSTQAA